MKIEWYAIAGLSVALLLSWGISAGIIHYYRSELLVVTAQFESFKDKTEALGEAAKADKIKQEALNEKAIASAVSERDAALARLRIEQGRPRGGFVPSAPAGSKDPGRICYERTALDAALRKLDTGVSGLFAEGDSAIINGRAILNSWPTQIEKGK